MQPFRIVIGYLPKVDRLPPDLLRLGLTYRLAFVQDSFCPSRVDSYFDSSLYEGLVNVVRNAVHADTIRVVLSERSRRDVCSPEEFRMLLEGIPEATRDPFPRLFLMRHSSAAAAVQSELWVRVGGPEPYHDSYTSAVFTASDLSDVLIERAREFADETGADITEIVRGENMPTQAGLLDRVKNFVGWC